jgi:hypothetical protein
MQSVTTFRVPCKKVLWTGFVFSSAASLARAVTLEWTRQIGTTKNDYSRAVAADGSGSVYVAGYTEGIFGGNNAGGDDAFVTKYTSGGTVQWTRQFGTNFTDYGLAITADGLGNLYICGSTGGNLGGFNFGHEDAYVAKYDAAGTHQWTRQFGTSTRDLSYGISADRLGNIYLTGQTSERLGDTYFGQSDAYIAKYNSTGTLLWTKQIGSTLDDSRIAVAADNLGNVYVTGITAGSLGGPLIGQLDAFVSKYRDDGSLLWTKQLGTPASDTGRGVSADGLGNVYISGITNGNLGATNAGGGDAFVAKYDASGSLVWKKQHGSSFNDLGLAISVDGMGGVFASGETEGSLSGSNAGGRDAFVSKYNAAGTRLWVEQLGTVFDDNSASVFADHMGNVYISGFTDGGLDDPSAGMRDAFISKYAEPLGSPVGDLNHDLIVDAADFVVWRKNDSTQVGFNAWRGNFGTAQAAGGGWPLLDRRHSVAASSVPEPASLLLNVIGAMAIVMLIHRSDFGRKRDATPATAIKSLRT